jgi:hypothetical protein
MEQLRGELFATNPVEMRRRANAVLSDILAKRLDPRYRRTAIDVLKRLDEQQRAADRESLRTISAQLAILDGLEGRTRKRAHSTAFKLQVEERPPVDIGRLIDEIAALVAEQRPHRDIEPPPIPVRESSLDNPQHGAGRSIPVQATPAVEHATTPQSSESRLMRRAGTFGKAVWVRQPDPR